MKAVASQNSEAFASLRAIADHSFDSVAAGKVFEGRAVNYDSKKRPFTMHWRVVPIRGQSVRQPTTSSPSSATRA